MNPNSNKMTQNQPDQFRNELNPHSPMVLSSSPKITNSALHNNNNNNNTTMSTTLGPVARRQASAPPLASKERQLAVRGQCSMPCHLNGGKRSNRMSYAIHHSLLDERIINCKLSIASKKDFHEEVRALVDVHKFAQDSVIMTDIVEVRIPAIVSVIVERIVIARNLPEEVAVEAKALLFVERDSLEVLLSNTLQGLYKSRADGRLAYDNSWIVATASLASLHKRQVAIARFPQPVNFGRQSQEVRFLIVVLAPNREKATKGAWETGRTFATMFTDINFRRALLATKSHDEFKMELVLRAEALAKEGELAGTYSATLGPSSNGGSHQLPQLQITTGSVNQNATFDLSSLPSLSMPSLLPDKSTKSDHAPWWPAPPYSGYSPSSSDSTDRLLGSIGSGLRDDLTRRAKFYLSDFTDGILGERSLYKTISTTIFLYFSVLLPCIAFGVVDSNNTEGHIDPRRTITGQAIGGLAFAILSGQPLVVIMTTAPLCIYIKVIYQISMDLEIDFYTFYACVGLWMAFFLVLMSVGNLSRLMKFCTRSTEDIFALFTAFAFGSDGVKEAIRSFQKYYYDPDCFLHQELRPTSNPMHPRVVQDSPTLLPRPTTGATTNNGLLNYTNNFLTSIKTNYSMPLHLQAQTSYGGDLDSTDINAANAATNAPSSLLHHPAIGEHSRCQRETCILFLFLMSGTLWLANSFAGFDKTPYLSMRKREIIKDYALAISVLIFSFSGSYLFSDIRLDVFEFAEFSGLSLAPFSALTLRATATAALLGFMLSILFYIDQNICGAMVNNAPYKLRKGDYFHLDLLVLALLNSVLSLVGLPWMHGKLPHSHLHSKALADFEERVDEGHIQQTIVNIRETRLTQVLCSLFIAASLLAIPYPLSYIPLPVLSGVFLYTALAEFKSNSMIERVCLLFTEQAAYPPNHYIRRCPQRKIHMFTFTQIAQLALVSLVGFYPNPYVSMAYPLVVATFVPIRAKLLPYLIDSKYLNSLDRPSLE